MVGAPRSTQHSPTLLQATPHLAQAYAHCEAITRHHSKSFYFATMLLPPPKRQAIRALYAFCRWSDDIVDEPHPSADSFEVWLTKVHAPLPPRNDPVLLAWHDVRTRYQLPTPIINELLAGMHMDLSQNRYATFADLWVYCYRVASTVGLLSMQIIGAAPGAATPAITLGVALQLTNILRDIGEDARRGRIYLPQDELAAFGLNDADLLAGRNDARWQALMRFQIARAHALYAQAWPGIALLHPDSRAAVAAAAHVYRAILTKIEANGYDTFTQRAHVPNRQKILMLPRILWQTARLSPPHGPT